MEKAEGNTKRPRLIVRGNRKRGKGKKNLTRNVQGDGRKKRKYKDHKLQSVSVFLAVQKVRGKRHVGRGVEDISYSLRPQWIK